MPQVLQEPRVAARGGASALHVQLDAPLPDEVATGAGSALFVCGWCFSPRARIVGLEFVVGGECQRVTAHGMPRLDPWRELGEPNSYRSGFWGIVTLAPPPGDSAAVEIGLRAELEGGGSASAPLARIALRRTLPSPLAAGPVSLATQPSDTASTATAITGSTAPASPTVAICMATYNPPPDLLERQLNSIRAQTHEEWVCLISDDHSNPESYAALLAAVGDDPRFVVSRSGRRLGFYHNFERALTMAPTDVEFVALADQDDDWHSDKLATLVARIGDARLIYSDARVVARDGELISDTWWNVRRNNHSDMLSLLVANSVTGAASLLRCDLLDYALPFPPGQFAHFHDHWLGLTALATGEIAFVAEPLYDYVQHGDASLGHEAANRMTSLGDRLRHQRGLRERVRMWRLHYFVDFSRLLVLATILRARCGPVMAPAQRRVLERFLQAETSWSSVAALGRRGARELHGTPETLGAEWMLFHALAWRRLLSLSTRDRPQRWLRLDALPPPSLVMHPGRAELPEDVRVVADKIAPLRWSVSEAAPERINVLIPTIDLRHLFGGYIAKFNLASRLAASGRRVRIVTTDPVGALSPSWRSTLESYGGLAGLLDRVEVEFGRESPGIEVSPQDHFIATTWWTAHVARAALASIDRSGSPFLYLIQEYEPFTFPMGSFAALAAESYEFRHVPLFSTTLLRDYFAAHGLGVYAPGAAGRAGEVLTYENAITTVDPPNAGDLSERSSRRLLFYARPEPHAARNMFELGVLALARALDEGPLFAGWELNGIGTVQEGRRISLGGGRSLQLLPRAAQADYARTLRAHDVGLALMLTPHPSLVPIEMASAGMLTVTNSFENKTAAAMAEISANLITVEPTVEGVAAGLRAAAVAVGEVERRVLGSTVRWSRSWEETFSAQLLERVLAALDGPAA